MVKLVKDIVITGGSISGGNVNGAAEAKHLAELEPGVGPQNEVVTQIARLYVERSEKNAWNGAAMYDPRAVAVVVDPTDMHVDVETKGGFTRGGTVANRMGSNERNVLHGRPLRD